MSANLRSVLSLIEVALIVALLAVPFWVVVEFPESADDVASLYATLVPWFIGMVLLLVFRPQLETFFTGVAKALGRIRSIGSASTRAEFQQEGTELIADADAANVDGTPWHIRFIVSTIFGSQVAALYELNDSGPRNREGMVQFYSEFLQKGGDKNYTFEHWLRYLVDNSRAVTVNPQGLHEITPAGRRFVHDARRLGWGPASFRS